MQDFLKTRVSGKNIAVIGLARSGVAAAQVVSSAGGNAYGFDSKFNTDPVFFNGPDFSCFKGIYGSYQEADGVDFGLAVISPGVPMDSPTADIFADNPKIEMIAELEFAYRIACSCDGAGCEFISVTGTNGKTTVTSMLADIFRAAGIEHNLVGNIGVPACKLAYESAADLYLAEVSSFQIEGMADYHSKVSAVLNISPDHLDRHADMHTYADLKLEMLDRSDYVCLNADDTELLDMADMRLRKMEGAGVKAPKLLYFSLDKKVLGAYVQNGIIFLNTGEAAEPVEIMNISDFGLLGRHNLENAVAAVVIAFAAGVDTQSIKSALSDFVPVEHRIEPVANIAGVWYYNDSKGTNPDSTIKAVEAMPGPVHLIAGGYEKNSDFTQLLRQFKDKIKSLVLIGETAERIKEQAGGMGYSDISIAGDMAAAVKISSEKAAAGEYVLLSPASASWGMYKNFEERGEDFKTCVKAI